MVEVGVNSNQLITPVSKLKQACHLIPAVVRMPGKVFFAPSQRLIELESTIRIAETPN